MTFCPFSELPIRLQGAFAINKHTPALTAAATRTVHNGLKGTVGLGKVEDIVIPGAWLQPNSRNTDLLGLLENVDSNSRVRDDGHCSLLGRRKS